MKASDSRAYCGYSGSGWHAGLGKNILEHERSASERRTSFSPTGRSGSAERIYASILVALFERPYCGSPVLAHLISSSVLLLVPNRLEELSQHVQIERPCPDFANTYFSHCGLVNTHGSGVANIPLLLKYLNFRHIDESFYWTILLFDDDLRMAV
jgi:hypothetical protein